MTDGLIYIVLSPNGDVELLDVMPRWDWLAEQQTVREGYINGGDSAIVPMPDSNRTEAPAPGAVTAAPPSTLEQLLTPQEMAMLNGLRNLHEGYLDYDGFIRAIREVVPAPDGLTR